MAKHSLKVGFSFGATSGIITTLGLIVGLHSSTGSLLAVVGGILTIAIADSFSDALGIHISEESENTHTHKEIWIATAATFFAKFIFTITFIFPVLLFDISLAVIISVAWGFLMLSWFSYRMAKAQKSNPFKVIGEHLAIAVIVIIITYSLGLWISRIFKV